MRGRATGTSFPSTTDGIRGYLTVSVDDGHPLDERTAELLSRYGIRATFYVPATNRERPVLEPRALREIGSSFEIGGHTFHHVPLPRLAFATMVEEVRDGKAWCEDVLGHATSSFCYPLGKVDRRAVRAVCGAGYTIARTCRLNHTHMPKDPYRIGVSTQAFDHPMSVQLRHALVEGNLRGMVAFATMAGMATSWPRHFLRAVDWVQRHGGVAHLYLHSWEIDERHDWTDLDHVLREISDRTDLRRVTNGELGEQLGFGSHAP